MHYTDYDYKRGQQANRLKKFVEVSGDYDYKIYSRSFSGKMTKKRYKQLYHFCRLNSYSQHCHHEWDCCGCLHNQTLSFTYKHNQAIITLTQSFNY